MAPVIDTPSNLVYVPALINGKPGHITVDALKDSETDVLNLLQTEAVPLSIWTQIALGYFEYGHPRKYEKIAREAFEQSRLLPDVKEEERLELVNSLSAYYTHMSDQRKSDKEKCLELAQRYSSQGMEMAQFDPVMFAIHAFAYLAKGDKTSATNYFDIALTQDKEKRCTPGFVGKAILAYMDSDFEASLDWYCQALKSNPHCPAYVRLGMAHCWYQLKDVPKAKLCFQRVVELEPNNVSALVGLALVDMDIRNKASFEQSVQYLKRAFQLRPDHPMILNTFSDHFFHNQYALNQARKTQGLPPGNFTKSEELAQRAYESTEALPVKAQAWFQMGRAKHAEGELNEALNYYYHSVSTYSKIPLAQYALGQMYVWKEQPEDAIKHFQAALQCSPEDKDTLMALGKLYLHLGRDLEAAAVLKKVTEQHKSSIDAWLLLGYARRGETEIALKTYAVAVRLLKAKKGDVDYTVWSDAGVFHHKAGFFEDAQRLYEEALSKAGGDLNSEDIQHLPIIFNTARLREDQGLLDDAFGMFRNIVKRFPTHLECYLGMARICLKRQDREQAAQWLETALGVDSSQPEAWLMLGDAYAHNKEWIRAQDKYEYVLNNIMKQDAHAALGMGFIYLNALQQATLPDKEEKYSRLAADFYQKALQNDQANIYAAHGLGCYMAFRGHYDEARQTLSRVSEASFAIREESGRDLMLINLANAHLMVGNFNQASKMFQNIIRRYPASAVHHNIYALWAQALFFLGEYYQAIGVLAKAIRTDPNNQRLWLNLALAQLMQALQQLHSLQPGNPAHICVMDFPMCKSTLSYFTLAVSNFERVMHYYGKHVHHPLFLIAQENLAVCQANRPNAEMCMDRAHKAKSETSAKMRKFREMQARVVERRLKHQAEAEGKNREEKAALNKRLEEERLRIEELNLRFQNQAESEQRAVEKRQKEADADLLDEEAQLEQLAFEEETALHYGQGEDEEREYVPEREKKKEKKHKKDKHAGETKEDRRARKEAQHLDKEERRRQKERKREKKREREADGEDGSKRQRSE
eukprot:NODE_98_length_3206_cov_30.755440_g91_i0.p1 GENE.NODE_98_length_3206_cov_30.755440_g91_i0~~NODE_98_length_3206_cov_30.755440_g91_i0.p1  ORF type:complete len:1050 (-),score=320.08 NODE_98_length_3206_cov_30.755440_g91_i0:56-3172(-)